MLSHARMIPYVSGASAPPAYIASAAPVRIAAAASPIACVPEAHAETTAYDGPLAWCFVATALAAALYIDAAIDVGGMRGEPSPYIRLYPASSVSQPPRPVPMIEPMRWGGRARVSTLASAAASAAAISANREKRSNPRCCPSCA